jgi:sulfoxide reductase heme-binding subunit YedZ
LGAKLGSQIFGYGLCLLADQIEREASLTRVRDSHLALWVLLSVPAALMVYGYQTDGLSYGEVIHASGDWSVRLLILTLAVTPLRLLFPGAGPVMWLTERRRDFGVATFLYALLHTVVYLARKADIVLIIEEGLEPGLWTGWLAFAVLALLAITSNRTSVRMLGGWWKKLHRLVYAGTLLTFAHWLLVAFDMTVALIYAAVLTAIELCRIVLSVQRTKKSIKSI